MEQKAVNKFSTKHDKTASKTLHLMTALSKSDTPQKV